MFVSLNFLALNLLKIRSALYNMWNYFPVGLFIICGIICRLVFKSSQVLLTLPYIRSRTYNLKYCDKHCNINMYSSTKMSYLATLSLIIISTLLITTRAANFNIRNNCPYVVWAGAYPGGGRQLNPNQEWSLDVPPGTQFARIWGRTNCNSDASVCETGDCGRLDCTAYGKTPNTVAEYALNQFKNYDYYDISLIDGFNITGQTQ